MSIYCESRISKLSLNATELPKLDPVLEAIYVRKRMGPQGIGKIYGQEKNITTYNLGGDGRDREERLQPHISRYISTAVGEEEISLEETNAELVEIEGAIQTATAKHNEFLKELGLSPLPSP